MPDGYRFAILALTVKLWLAVLCARRKNASAFSALLVVKRFSRFRRYFAENAFVLLAFEINLCYYIKASNAGVMELADVGDSKSPAGDSVPVRVRPPAPKKASSKELAFFVSVYRGEQLFPAGKVFGKRLRFLAVCNAYNIVNKA